MFPSNICFVNKSGKIYPNILSALVILLLTRGCQYDFVIIRDTQKMVDLIPSPTIRKLFVIICIACIFLVYYCKDNYTTTNLIVYEKISKPVQSFNEQEYLVYSSKCHIINLEAFNSDAKKYHKPKKYERCTHLELLTYVTKTDNIATLHIDNEIVPSYSKTGVSCCYSNVTRKTNLKKPDDYISVSNCIPFQNSTTIPDTILVTCTSATKNTSTVYKNAHNAVTIKENLKNNTKILSDNTTKPMSVLFLGIDSVSRLNLIRNLPKTYGFLEDNHWISLKGYNKMGDNTFPNLMAIFTGYNMTDAYKICNPVELGNLDNCSMIWKKFSQHGYITGYGEDESKINTFNYRKKGFRIQPTDYYFRPYFKAAEKLDILNRDSLSYCTGPETSGERLLNIAKDFSITLQDYANFGIFWTNTFSHNDINSVSKMDNKILGTLKDITESGVTNNSIVIFISDHGIRFGDVRYTFTGWYEERLPFIYISLPPYFSEKFPNEYNNLLSNVNKLTTPYDLHLTLQHIIQLSGFNYSIVPSRACPTCNSLFGEIENVRSCADAAIEQHWCTCTGYQPVNTTDIISNAVSYTLQEIKKIIDSKRSAKKCAKFSLSSIKSASISENTLSNQNTSYILIVFKTKPPAVFEATIDLQDIYNASLSHYNFKISGDISRLDSYEQHSKCISSAYLKKYCYCR